MLPGGGIGVPFGGAVGEGNWVDAMVDVGALAGALIGIAVKVGLGVPDIGVNISDGWDALHAVIEK